MDAAVAHVAEDLVAAGEEVREGVVGDHDVVAVARHCPMAMTWRLRAQMMIWVLMLRR